LARGEASAYNTPVNEVKQILRTKLYIPPVRAGIASRPRLLERLDGNPDARLLLVAAPAGFGKTTLLAEWVATKQQVAVATKQRVAVATKQRVAVATKQRVAVATKQQVAVATKQQVAVATKQPEAAVAWLSLDEQDDDPSRFYAYLMAALQTIDPTIGRSVQEALRSTQLAALSPESVITLLLNDLSQRAQPGILVLDDYQVIHAPAIHQAIQFWLDNQPPGFQLALTSRSTPPLALSRLRVRHELVEIDADDLRFTPAESADFLNQVMKLDLTPEDMRSLTARTEGWIASLQLAALSLQGNPDPHDFVLNFAGDDRFVMDYLMEEVLQRQPGYIRDFLLQTSLLTRLNVQLCNAVTGQVGGQQILEDLDQRNLFVVPLDSRRHWYRYHQLFAEFLAVHLERTSPEKIPLIHKRAADWYAANDYPIEAVDHALLAGDFSAAADLMAGVADDILWGKGQLATLLRWIDSLPDGVRISHTRLALMRGWALYASGQWDRMEQELPRLEGLVQAEDDPTLAARWQGELLVLRAERAIFRSDIAQARRFFQQAEVLLADDEGLANGMLHQGLGYIYRLEGAVKQALVSLKKAHVNAQANGYVAAQLFSLYDIAAVHLLAGNLTGVLDCYAEMEQAVHDSLVNPMIASQDVVRGMALYEQGHLDKAAERLERSVVGAQTIGMFGFARMAHLALARLRQSQGNSQTALAEIQAALQLARQGETHWVVAQAKAMQARVLLAQARADEVAAWAALVARPLAERGFLPRVQQQQEQIVYARYLLATGVLEHCAALLDSLAVTAEAAGWCSHLVEIHLLAALCAQAQGGTTAALLPLGAALHLGEKLGYVQIFLDDGPGLRPLLEVAQKSDTFALSLLARIPTDATPLSPTSGLAEPLTRRETEILRLVAAGLSNQQIANRLTIALGTVGKHTSNIFVKLDAPNRTAAVLRAGELGLV